MAETDTTKTGDTPTTPKAQAESGAGRIAASAPAGRSPDGESQDLAAPAAGEDNAGVLEETLLRATPQPATTTDALGVERIVTYPNDWTPAPTEPDPDAVKRAEERNRRFAEEREGRLTKFVDTDTHGDTAAPAVDALSAERG